MQEEYESPPPVPLGTVIAQRTMTTEAGGRVTISIGQPVFLGDGWDWACPYQVDGLKSPIKHRVFGIDALQTLQLVSVSIRSELEECGEPLTWLDDDFWQAGFPMLLQSYGNRQIEEKLLKVLEQTFTRPSD